MFTKPVQACIGWICGLMRVARPLYEVDVGLDAAETMTQQQRDRYFHLIDLLRSRGFAYIGMVSSDVLGFERQTKKYLDLVYVDGFRNETQRQRVIVLSECQGTPSGTRPLAEYVTDVEGDSNITTFLDSIQGAVRTPLVQSQ